MKDLRFAKFVLLVNGLVPGTLLLWDALHGQAGANPVNYAIRTTGMLALIFLPLSLLVTPLRKITGFNWLFHFRRTLGLYAFFYALAHFSIFFIFDRSLNIGDTLSEMVKRPYLIVGSVGLLTMVPLAVTSTNYMIRKMGARRWKELHRFAYVAAVAGVVHFYMQVKSDIRKPVAFAIVVGILLGYRVVMRFAGLLRKSPQELPGFPVDVTTDGETGEAVGAGRWSGQLRVQKIVQETAEVRTFRLVAADGRALPFTYLPGQYLTVTLEVAGKKVRRNYTIASTPTRSGFCEVTIKREENGVASRHMHEVVKEGDVLAVSAPSGRFTFAGEGVESVALLAGGVGITPLMAIVRYLTDRQWKGRIHLVYCSKMEPGIIFRREIEELQRRHANLHVTMTLTRAEGMGWGGAIGRIDAALLTRVIPGIAGMPVFICGPSEMLGAMRGLLPQLGVLEGDIHTESFGAKPAVPVNGEAGAGHRVTFSRSKRSARINGDRSILELAEELGIGVESDCRSGICGTCKCRMVSGSVAMETQEALDAGDRASGIILLCQARALEDVTVEA